MATKFGKNQQGQALLVVVLVMVIALTIGLSAASRSLTNVKTSTEEANSAQALAAAEAGVAKTLQTNVAAGTGNFGGIPAYDTSLTVASIADRSLNGGNPVPQDEGVELLLTPYGNYSTPWNGDLRVHWGESTTPCNEAAMEIIVLRATSSTKYAYDPCVARRTGKNNFTGPSGFPSLVAGKWYYYRALLPTISNGLIVKIIPLYKNSNIAVFNTSGTAIPTQGSIISSTGTAGDVQRKITVFQGQAAVPNEFFSYGIFVPK